MKINTHVYVLLALMLTVSSPDMMLADDNDSVSTIVGVLEARLNHCPNLAMNYEWEHHVEEVWKSPGGTFTTFYNDFKYGFNRPSFYCELGAKSSPSGSEIVGQESLRFNGTYYQHIIMRKLEFTQTQTKLAGIGSFYNFNPLTIAYQFAWIDGNPHNINEMGRAQFWASVLGSVTIPKQNHINGSDTVMIQVNRETEVCEVVLSKKLDYFPIRWKKIHKDGSGVIGEVNSYKVVPADSGFFTIPLVVTEKGLGKDGQDNGAWSKMTVDETSIKLDPKLSPEMFIVPTSQATEIKDLDINLLIKAHIVPPMSGSMHDDKH